MHNSIDPGPAPFFGAPDDVFGITLADVELLTHTCRIRPETSRQALNGDSPIGGLVGALIFPIGALISINLASGGVAVFATFTVAAVVATVVMMRMKNEEDRAINEDGPAIELHNGVQATGLTVGHCPAIAQLMAEVHAVANGWDDPI